jgi:hypothetical protein
MIRRGWFAIAISVLLMIWIQGCGTESVPSYRLTVSSQPDEGGTVDPGGGEFEAGQTVQVTATPNEGWLFVRWEGNITGSSNPEIVKMESNAWVRAVFEKRTYPLTLTVEGKGSILEEVVQAKTVDHPHGTVVRLRPAPESGWRFSNWGGELLSGSEVPAEITINEPVAVTATFVPLEGSVRTYGGSRREFGYSVTATSDGGYALTGETSSEDGDFEGQYSGDDDLVVIKVDADGNREWVRLFGDTELDQGYSITETADGGIVVSGKTYTDRWTTLIIKLDQDGTVLWERTYYKSSGEALTATADGGVVVTGFSFSDTGVFEGLQRGETDAYLMKLSAAGEVEWVRTYGGSNGEVGTSVVQTADGGFLLSGWAYSNDGTFDGVKDHIHMAGFLVRTDAIGEVEWARFLTEIGDIYSFKTESPDVTETIDGRFLFVYGDCKAGDTLGSMICRYHLTEVDRSGETLWKKTFSGSESDIIQDITAAADGGVILTGNTASDDGDFSGLTLKGRSDILIHKLTATGETEWMNNFGGSNWERAESIIQIQNKGYVLTGTTGSNDGDFEGMLRNQTDIVLIKTDTNGELLQEW